MKINLAIHDSMFCNQILGIRWNFCRFIKQFIAVIMRKFSQNKKGVNFGHKWYPEYSASWIKHLCLSTELLLTLVSLNSNCLTNMSLSCYYRRYLYWIILEKGNSNTNNFLRALFFEKKNTSELLSFGQHHCGNFTIYLKKQSNVSNEFCSRSILWHSVEHY